jgi:hypothetical protein
MSTLSPFLRRAVRWPGGASTHAYEHRHGFVCLRVTSVCPDVRARDSTRLHERAREESSPRRRLTPLPRVRRGPCRVSRACWSSAQIRVRFRRLHSEDSMRPVDRIRPPHERRASPCGAPAESAPTEADEPMRRSPLPDLRRARGRRSSSSGARPRARGRSRGWPALRAREPIRQRAAATSGRGERVQGAVIARRSLAWLTTAARRTQRSSPARSVLTRTRARAAARPGITPNGGQGQSGSHAPQGHHYCSTVSISQSTHMSFHSLTGC